MSALRFRRPLERLEAAVHRYVLDDRPPETPALQRVLSAQRAANDELTGYAAALGFEPGRGVPGVEQGTRNKPLPDTGGEA